MIRYDIKIDWKSRTSLSGECSMWSFEEQKVVDSFYFEQHDGKTSFTPKPPARTIPVIPDDFTTYLHTWLSGFNKEWEFFFWERHK